MSHDLAFDFGLSARTKLLPNSIRFLGENDMPVADLHLADLKDGLLREVHTGEQDVSDMLEIAESFERLAADLRARAHEFIPSYPQNWTE